MKEFIREFHLSLTVAVATCMAVGHVDALQADHPLATQRDISLRQYLETQFDLQIEQVRVDTQRVLITGTAAPTTGTQLRLAEIRPHEHVAGVRSFPRTFPINQDADGKFRLILDRCETGYDRIHSRWAIIERQAEQDHLRSHAVYATDIREAARYNDLKPLTPSSPKGIAGVDSADDLNDLLELGAKNITVNISLGSLLQLDEHNALEHEHAGCRFFFRRRSVQRLDRVLEFADKHGIVVSVILLVPRRDRGEPLGRILTHPDAVDGHYSLANVTSAEGVDHFAAAIGFLAERYGPPDAPHGRITHWILHNEINSGWVWTNAGEKSPLAYMDDYIKAMRITYFAARTYNPYAKVFVSLDHCWNEPHRPDDPRFYRGRELLEILQQYTEAEGDFEWGVAYHPYPENLFEPRTWRDQQAQFRFDTPQITFRNLEVLEQWLQQPAYRYHGRVRTVLLSEQGFHSGDNSPRAQEIQAAALAYAWNKIQPLQSIEAFHYHRRVDHEREGGLNLGLWTVQPGTISRPSEKKKAWFVFRALGTEQETMATRFAKDLIGIDHWSDIRGHHDMSP